MNARRKLSNEYYMEMFNSQRNLTRDADNQIIHQEQRVRDLMEECDEKVDRMRAQQFKAKMKLEQEMDEYIIRKEIEKKTKEEILEREKKLAEEIERRNKAALRDEKLRQQVRLNSHELRDLEFRLNSALISKEVAAQIAEKITRKLESNAEEIEFAHYLEEEAKRLDCLQMQKEMERKRIEAEHACELEKQIQEQEKKKQKDYETFLKEKMRIDEIVKTVMEEQRREFQRQLENKEKSFQDIKNFQQATQEWKDREKQISDEEYRQVNEYNKMQEERKAEQSQQKRDLDLSKAKVQKQIGDILEEKQREKDEWEKIQQELCEEEEMEALHQREKKEIEDRIRQKIDLQKEHEFQMHYRKLQQEADKKEEEELRKQLLAKYEEDERLQLLNDQKRRMKMQEYKREVEEIIKSRRELQIKERERELNELKLISDREKYLQQIVDEERRRLIRENAAKLIGFMPKGIFKDEKDLELLEPELREEFARHQPILDCKPKLS